jgi:pimeloyl-ACP methyl ester carboxylesterase
MDPFFVNIDKQVLSDLQKRLAATRWVDEFDNEKWETGTNKSYLQDLCSYWKQDFDWKWQENFLNSFQHYKSTIDHLGVHFIHQKGKARNSVPLLLLHGYPDSFVRFLKVIPLLTDADEKDFSFDIIIPSIPGFGFSDRPTKSGMNTKQIAKLFATLMTKELGYEKFIVHGSDWGAGIGEQLALYHDELLLGLHLTDVPFQHGIIPIKSPTTEEERFLEKTKKWQMTEGAYSMIQSTKPQSLAYGLNDSPAGLAAWIVEKFKAWSDNDGSIENVFTKDELLLNITIYWVTQTINSSFRIYYEAMKSLMNAMYNPIQKFNPFDKTEEKVMLPTAFALFPKDIAAPPRDFANRFFNVKRWTEMKKGGHFTAMEQPALLAQDIREFALQIIGSHEVATA